MKTTSYQPTQVRDDLMVRIDAIDLAPIKFKLMDSKEGHGWSREKVDSMEREYKRFLYMTTSQSEVPVVPNKELDEFWHTHILDTRKYAQDCERTFGRFIHHFPYLGMRGKEDAQLLQDSFSATKGLYQKVFGEKYDGRASDCENCGSCTASCGVCSTSGTTDRQSRLDDKLGISRRPTLEATASN